MKNKLLKILLIEEVETTAKKFSGILKQNDIEFERVKGANEAINLIMSNGKFPVYLMDVGQSDRKGSYKDSIREVGGHSVQESKVVYNGVDKLRELNPSSAFFGYSARNYPEELRDPRHYQQALEVKSHFDEVFWEGDEFLEDKIISSLRLRGYKF